MSRVCGNCGATQGPFAREVVGESKTRRYIFTCPTNRNGKTLEERRKPVTACLSRRAQQEEVRG